MIRTNAMHAAFKVIATALLLCLSAACAGAKTPVEKHGRLQVAGNRIVGAHGEPVSLSGVSFGWSQWDAARFYNAGAVGTLAGDWRASIVRAALGVHQTGFLSKPAENEARVVSVIDAAIANGIYVIIDWHDHHAHKHPELAVAFFERMARAYGDRPNVIYEIFNEPLRGVSWSDEVKPYSERVIAAIRAIDPDNLILVGSPSWSQDVDVATADPVSDPNVAYTLHFYAGTHKQWLRDKALVALNRGFALFVSEWGVCNADGDGPIDRASTDEWLAFMREHKLSHCAWSLNDKRETCAMLQPKAPSDGNWTEKQITESGTLVRGIVRGWETATTWTFSSELEYYRNRQFQNPIAAAQAVGNLAYLKNLPGFTAFADRISPMLRECDSWAVIIEVAPESGIFEMRMVLRNREGEGLVVAGDYDDDAATFRSKTFRISELQSEKFEGALLEIRKRIDSHCVDPNVVDAQIVYLVVGTVNGIARFCYSVPSRADEKCEFVRGFYEFCASLSS